MADNCDIPKFPTHIQIQTTTGCAYRCRYCPQWGKIRTDKKIMKQSLFNDIVQELNVHSPVHISPYLMADPLTDPQIFLRIDKLRSKCSDSFIEVSTTPELITQNRIPRLIVSPFSELRISMPTIDAARYANLREGASVHGAVQRIEALIDAWIASGERVRLVIVLLKGVVPADDFENSVEFWRKRGVPVMTWPVTSRAGNMNIVVAPRNEELKGCSQGRATHWFHIGWDGSVILCCMDYKKIVDLGSLGKKTIAEIWESTKYQHARLVSLGYVDPPKDFPCVRCEWAGAYQEGAFRYKPMQPKDARGIK